MGEQSVCPFCDARQLFPVPEDGVFYEGDTHWACGSHVFVYDEDAVFRTEECERRVRDRRIEAVEARLSALEKNMQTP